MIKKFIKNFKAFPVIYVLLLFALLYLPAALVAPAESDKFAIVNAVGIDYDKEKQELEFSTLIHVPQENMSFNDKYKLYSGKSDTLTGCIKNIELHLGKQLGLVHVTLVVISDSVVAHDLTTSLDALVRTTEISNNTSLVYTPDSAKDVLNTSLKSYESSGVKLSDIVNFNEENSVSTSENIETYFRRLMLPTSTTILNVIKLESEQSEGIDVSPEDSSSGSGSGSNESGSGENSAGNNASKKEKNVLANTSEILLLKNGKKVAVFNDKQAKGINLINKSIETGKLQIENFTGEGLTNATIVFNIKVKTAIPILAFKDEKPFITYKVFMDLETVEIKEDNKNKELYFSQKTHLSPELKQKINEKINENFNSAYKILQENNCDLLYYYTRFNFYMPFKFKRYLESLDNKDDYLKGIKVKLEAIPTIKN